MPKSRATKFSLLLFKTISFIVGIAFISCSQSSTLETSKRTQAGPNAEMVISGSLNLGFGLLETKDIESVNVSSPRCSVAAADFPGTTFKIVAPAAKCSDESLALFSIHFVMLKGGQKINQGATLTIDGVEWVLEGEKLRGSSTTGANNSSEVSGTFTKKVQHGVLTIILENSEIAVCQNEATVSESNSAFTATLPLNQEISSSNFSISTSSPGADATLVAGAGPEAQLSIPVSHLMTLAAGSHSFIMTVEAAGGSCTLTYNIAVQTIVEESGIPGFSEIKKTYSDFSKFGNANATVTMVEHGDYDKFRDLPWLELMNFNPNENVAMSKTWNRDNECEPVQISASWHQAGVDSTGVDYNSLSFEEAFDAAVTAENIPSGNIETIIQYQVELELAGKSRSYSSIAMKYANNDNYIIWEPVIWSMQNLREKLASLTIPSCNNSRSESRSNRTEVSASPSPSPTPDPYCRPKLIGKITDPGLPDEVRIHQSFRCTPANGSSKRLHVESKFEFWETCEIVTTTNDDGSPGQDTCLTKVHSKVVDERTSLTDGGAGCREILESDSDAYTCSAAAGGTCQAHAGYQGAMRVCIFPCWFSVSPGVSAGPVGVSFNDLNATWEYSVEDQANYTGAGCETNL